MMELRIAKPAGNFTRALFVAMLDLLCRYDLEPCPDTLLHGARRELKSS